MKKIAFFVEGQTEQIFVTKLLTKLLGKKNLTIISRRIVGGTNAPKQEFVRNMSISRDPEYLALIYDCGSDNRVKSAILDNLESLKDSGYSRIIGVRDLYPLPLHELPFLKRGLNYLPKQYQNMRKPYEMIIAVREVETWFLSETHHFRRVDPRLTGPFIFKHLRFDPFSLPAVSREHPSKDLNDIYRLVGRSYTKKRWQVERLVGRLDYNYLQHHLRYDIPAMDELFTVIEDLQKNK